MAIEKPGVSPPPFFLTVTSRAATARQTLVARVCRCGRRGRAARLRPSPADAASHRNVRGLHPGHARMQKSREKRFKPSSRPAMARSRHASAPPAIRHAAAAAPRRASGWRSTAAPAPRSPPRPPPRRHGLQSPFGLPPSAPIPLPVPRPSIEPFPPPPWTLDSPLIRVQENRGRFTGSATCRYCRGQKVRSARSSLLIRKEWAFLPAAQSLVGR